MYILHVHLYQPDLVGASQDNFKLAETPSDAAILKYQIERGLSPALMVEFTLYRVNFENKTLEYAEIPEISFGR